MVFRRLGGREMDKLLILTILGVQTVLFLMGVSTLKHKLNSIEEGIKANTLHVELKCNEINETIQEKSKLNGKAFRILVENAKAIDIGVNKIRERDFELGQDIGRLKNNTKMIKDATTECMLCLERQICTSKESIEKTLEENKKDINRNTHKEVTRIIYTVPTVPLIKIMD
jgi:hypothetical protein